MIQLPEYIRKTNSQDGAIVLDLRHGRMFTLNLVGSKIFTLLDRQLNTAQIAGELSRQFGIDLDVATHDVREFLDALEKHRLIEVHPSAVAL